MRTTARNATAPMTIPAIAPFDKPLSEADAIVKLGAKGLGDGVIGKGQTIRGAPHKPGLPT